MSDTVITVENLCKKYTISHQKKARHINFRENLYHTGRRIAQRLRNPLSPNKENVGLEEFWALKNINFEIKRGDRVGIIGRNGAGKSTLLKILSRITDPISGRVEIQGRVTSLLEVGTGFHPELTGRENIFLNGAILGMSHREIKAKFDKIVDFSQIEKFLDTPVKRYSSGMYIRLAFAVAAHLEPEILLVDEVLAVGDASFQRKCLKKMGKISESGRTILFVSHRMDAIRRLCNRVLLLHEGAVVDQGEPDVIIKQYLSTEDLRNEMPDQGPESDKKMHLRWVKLLDENSKPCSHVNRYKDLMVKLCYDVNTPIRGAHVICLITDSEDRVILSTGDCDVGRSLSQIRDCGSYITSFPIPTKLFNDGEYSLTFSLSIPYGMIYDRPSNVVKFSVSDTREKSGPEYAQSRPGFIVKDIAWETTKR